MELMIEDINHLIYSLELIDYFFLNNIKIKYKFNNILYLLLLLYLLFIFITSYKKIKK